MNIMREHPSTPMTPTGPVRFLPWIALGLVAAGLFQNRIGPRNSETTPQTRGEVVDTLTDEPPPQTTEPVFSPSAPALPPGVEAVTGETDIERLRLMNEQVFRMREYAGAAGPNDPFSLTEEQIKEFQRQGSPCVW